MRGLVVIGVALASFSAVSPSEAGPRMQQDPRPVSPRIAGGYYPDPNAWPWVTAIINPTVAPTNGDFGPGRGVCTAVLISPTRVLTAAHCVVGADRTTPKPPGQFQVLVGRRDLTQVNQGERRNVTGVVVHPQVFLPTSGIHMHHAFYDIAVLFLDNPVTTIPPATIGLPTDWNTWATVMGFGHYNYDHTNRLYDQHLRAADFDLLGDAQCAAAFDDATTQHYYPAIHVCANNAPDSATIDCITHGDSGGPLMVLMPDNTWRLIGITSFYPYRADRCSAGGPFGFAWVAGAAMRDWPLTVPPPQGTTTNDTTTTSSAIGSPSRVRRLTVRSRRSSPRFTIDWRPPATNGGAAIVRYEVRVYDGTKLLVKKAVPGSRSRVKIRKSKLHRGRNQIYVTAFNGVKYAPWVSLTVRRSRT